MHYDCNENHLALKQTRSVTFLYGAKLVPTTSVQDRPGGFQCHLLHGNNSEHQNLIVGSSGMCQPLGMKGILDNRRQAGRG